MRLTVSDVLQSRFPQVLGLCADDVTGVCKAIDACTQRLLYAAQVGDAGFAGSWAEAVFTMDRDDPYLVLSREMTRPEAVNLCSWPIPLHNEFFEFLRFGHGTVPKRTSIACQSQCAPLGAYDRGQVPTFKPIVGTRKSVRVYLTDSADVDSRVLIQCRDLNGQTIYTLDGLVQVTGVFLVLAAPFVDLTLDGAPLEILSITGIQKDVTLGSVMFYERDLDTGAERLISQMDPGETVASYRRYFLSGLPKNCCDASDSTSTTVQVQAIVQLGFIPVRSPCDYPIINNLEALIAEGQALRMSTIDGVSAKSEAQEYHRQAIRLLNGQLIAEQGKLNPSVQFAPFGSARLSRQRIGSLW